MKRAVAVLIEGMPATPGFFPEFVIADILSSIPKVRLLTPVQFLRNGVHPSCILYGVFLDGVISGGLAEDVVRAFRQRYPDANMGSFHVRTSDFADSDFYDEAEEGYLTPAKGE